MPECLSPSVGHAHLGWLTGAGGCAAFLGSSEFPVGASGTVLVLSNRQSPEEIQTPVPLLRQCCRWEGEEERRELPPDPQVQYEERSCTLESGICSLLIPPPVVGMVFVWV